MTVPVVPFVKVPSPWIVFGPATAFSMLAGYVLARVERGLQIGGAGQTSVIGPEHLTNRAPEKKAA